MAIQFFAAAIPTKRIVHVVRCCRISIKHLESFVKIMNRKALVLSSSVLAALVGFGSIGARISQAFVQQFEGGQCSGVSYGVTFTLKQYNRSGVNFFTGTYTRYGLGPLLITSRPRNDGGEVIELFGGNGFISPVSGISPGFNHEVVNISPFRVDFQPHIC